MVYAKWFVYKFDSGKDCKGGKTMNRPRTAPGCCRFYDHPSSYCYLTEGYQDGYTRDAKCKSSTGCKTCGNYEAWASGRKYKGK